MRERRRRLRRLRRLPTRQVSSAGAEHSQRRRAQIGRQQRAEGERRRVHKASVSHRPRATRPIRLWPMRRLRRRRRQAAEQSQSVAAAAAAASAVDNCDCLMSDAAARMCVRARRAHKHTPTRGTGKPNERCTGNFAGSFVRAAVRIFSLLLSGASVHLECDRIGRAADQIDLMCLSEAASLVWQTQVSAPFVRCGGGGAGAERRGVHSCKQVAACGGGAARNKSNFASAECAR